MFFDLDCCVGHITDNFNKQITEAFSKKLESTNITRTQWIAMYYIITRGLISQRELSNLMMVADSSIGRLLDRLERDGLIQRIKRDTDRRISYLQLTEKGHEEMKPLMQIGVEFNNELLKGITKEEKETYERVLSKILNNIKNK